ncbi:MAG: response regulator transcription factor [Rhodocyclaceae bacterium]|nr:response regulator transcription factor [Rhodocyclaceae bacterium]
MTEPMKVLIVDDEALARARMRDLLSDIAAEEPTRVVAMVANGAEALRLLDSEEVDLVFADVRMPVMDGVEFARQVLERPNAPGVIFTTAYDEYAVTAFDVAAIDYLLKPVRASRLAEALGKFRRSRGKEEADEQPDGARINFSVTERGRILLVPVDEVRYLKAELKYVTAHTIERDYVLDESLVQLEEEFGTRFLRIHRNCLVARSAVLGVERQGGSEGDPHWAVLLEGVGEPLSISRRQWPSVKTALKL